MLTTKALPGVPRRTVLAAHAVPLVTLPAALWRLAFAFGLPVSEIPIPHAWQVLSVVGLAVITEGLALLTLGLVRPWGETVPGWIPLLGGRRVHPLAATVPAVLGGLVLAFLLYRAFWSYSTHIGLEGTGTPGQFALLLVCYVPMLSWPPLLIAVALAYYRRRTATPSASDALREDAA
jgi:hypothetical protein